MSEGVGPNQLGKALPPAEGEEPEEGRKRDVLLRQPPGTRGDQLLAWKRRDEISALLGSGHRQAAIARELEVDEATVRYHINVMLQYHRERALATFDERQARQLAIAEAMLEEVLDCFERSKAGRKVQYSEQVGEMLHNLSKRQRRKAQGTKENGTGEPKPKGGPGKYKRYTREEQSHGDPRFMALAIELFKECNRLLAVYPADRPEAEDGKVDRQLAKMPPATLAGKVRALLQSAQLQKQRQEAERAEEATPVAAQVVSTAPPEEGPDAG
jgi:hypothetical protein